MSKEVCSICFVEIGKNVQALECFHLFHSECITQYHETYKEKREINCPLCRYSYINPASSDYMNDQPDYEEEDPQSDGELEFLPFQDNVEEIRLLINRPYHENKVSPQNTSTENKSSTIHQNTPTEIRNTSTEIRNTSTENKTPSEFSRGDYYSSFALFPGEYQPSTYRIMEPIDLAMSRRANFIDHMARNLMNRMDRPADDNQTQQKFSNRISHIENLLTVVNPEPFTDESDPTIESTNDQNTLQTHFSCRPDYLD